MALIKCPECGREISDKAPACPHCGTPVANKKIPVHFEREKTFSGSLTTGTVMVDGVTVGSAGNGASFDVMLTAGMHSVVIESKAQGVMGVGRTTSETIDIPADAKKVNVLIVAKTDAGTLFGGGGMAVKIGSVRVIR